MTLALVERADERLSALERLEVLCDPGSLQLIRTQVRSRRMGDKAREGDGILAASGAVEAIATIATLREGVVAPTLGLEQPDEGLDLDFVPGKARPLVVSDGRKPIGVSNSFGFGGHNAVLVLEAA